MLNPLPLVSYFFRLRKFRNHFSFPVFTLSVVNSRSSLFLQLTLSFIFHCRCSVQHVQVMTRLGARLMKRCADFFRGFFSCFFFFILRALPVAVVRLFFLFGFCNRQSSSNRSWKYHSQKNKKRGTKCCGASCITHFLGHSVMFFFSRFVALLLLHFNYFL